MAGSRGVGKKLLFSLIMTFSALGLAELGLGLAGWPQPPSDAQFTHNSVYWKLPPNRANEATEHREVQSTFPVSTDENGLRNKHPVKKGAAKRVMMMGCSTTFGWGVADEQTLPARLEARLDGVEVINAAQPGYTTFQGIWLWEQALAQYQPDVVFLGFVVQDARKVAFSDLSQAMLQQEGDFLKRNVLYQWRLYRLLQELLGKVQVRTKESGDVYRVSEKEYLDNLRTLRREIEATGATVVHFGFPLEAVGYTEQHRRLLRLEAEAAGLRWFDPSDQVADEARRRQLVFPTDRGHLNADGLDYVAGLMAAWMKTEGIP